MNKIFLCCVCMLFCHPVQVASMDDGAAMPVVLPEYTCYPAAHYAPSHPMTLWYTAPVTAMQVDDPWQEYALPIGNGQLGAMIYGGIRQDIVQFNEKTLWTGSAEERGSYQNFGALVIENIGASYDRRGVYNYYRNLDLSNATAVASWSTADGDTVYTREYIASNPAQCVVIHMKASVPRAINNRFYLNDVHGRETYYQGKEGMFAGKLTTVSYCARMKVAAVGGTVTTTNGGIVVKHADEVMVVLAAGTDYNAVAPSYISHTTLLPLRIKNTVDSAVSMGWQALYSRHVEDYKAFYDRTDLQLGGVTNTISTDKLIDGYAENYEHDNRYRLIEQLYFQYGRYLLISSSRGVDLPNNLQGIWNNSNEPAWQCDMHADINVQMNYWLANNTNLSEMNEKLLNYIYNMALVQPQWKSYARVRLRQQNGWACFTENNIFGHCTAWQNNYCAAGAWLCAHLWQHYRYTLDREFLLHKALPVMVSQCKFWLERLVKATDGTYECPDEYSPEHGPGTESIPGVYAIKPENATAHAQQLVKYLFSATLKAISIVGNKAACVDRMFVKALKERLLGLDTGLHNEVYTGKWGNVYNGVTAGDSILREWKYTDYADGNGKERDHRHLSHLMELYPLDGISPKSPYFLPAVNSLRLRGIQSQGWSMGWKINLWARAFDGDVCAKIFKMAFQHSKYYTLNMSPEAGGIYYNMLDAHSPFQIDGNFGVAAGMAEMLLQSCTDTIHLLPALPKIWSEGTVRRLCAVNRFEISETWADMQLTEVTVKSLGGMRCRLYYRGIGYAKITDKNGRMPKLRKKTADYVEFDTDRGNIYRICF